MGDEPNGVTLSELGRMMNDVKEELRALRGEHVRRDLYDAHRASVAADIDRQREDIARVERKVDQAEADKATTRRALLGTGVGAGLSLLASLILLLVK